MQWELPPCPYMRALVSYYMCTTSNLCLVPGCMIEIFKVGRFHFFDYLNFVALSEEHTRHVSSSRVNLGSFNKIGSALLNSIRALYKVIHLEQLQKKIRREKLRKHESEKISRIFN